MQVRLFNWLGREFIEISGEGKAGIAADRATEELFNRFEKKLRAHDFSLDDAVRVRVWGRDKTARVLATAVRAKILVGNHRVASSSFISEEWFESDGVTGLELLAMRPAKGSAERRAVDFSPARNYLCYLRYDPVLFFSGLTSDAATLDEQVPNILLSLANAFAVSGASWSKVTKLSIYLQRSQDLLALRRLLANGPRPDVPEVEISLVDGFAADNYLIEIEATALLD
jgi:enamine deaminase RidA (YjgF/YER057c/UK114 family)